VTLLLDALLAGWLLLVGGDFQLGGMLKIPLFAAPAVKFRKTVVRLLRSSQSARAVTVKTHLHHS
jgi:hypothetical protein